MYCVIQKGKGHRSTGIKEERMKGRQEGRKEERKKEKKKEKKDRLGKKNITYCCLLSGRGKSCWFYHHLARLTWKRLWQLCIVIRRGNLARTRSQHQAALRWTVRRIISPVSRNKLKSYIGLGHSATGKKCRFVLAIWRQTRPHRSFSNFVLRPWTKTGPDMVRKQCQRQQNIQFQVCDQRIHRTEVICWMPTKQGRLSGGSVTH